MSTLDCAHLFENKKLCFTATSLILKHYVQWYKYEIIKVWLGQFRYLILVEIWLINFFATKFEQNPCSAVMGHCMHNA